jgi:hypothetical protein
MLISVAFIRNISIDVKLIANHSASNSPHQTQNNAGLQENQQK